MSLEERLNRLKLEKGNRAMIVAAARGGQIPGVTSATEHFARLEQDQVSSVARAQSSRVDGGALLCEALPLGRLIEFNGCRVFHHRATVPLDDPPRDRPLPPWEFPQSGLEVLDDASVMQGVYPQLVESAASWDPCRVAFIDTETTGLAGGAGTCVFLVGAGWFVRDEHSSGISGFEVEQWLIEDFCHEPVMLELLEQRLSQFDAIGSYNGKRFDVPLLRARGIVNRMRFRTLDKPHVDLLYLSRRLWRERLGSASLGTVEQGIFQIEREHDVPGALAPGIWEEFARTGQPGLLPLVVHHNAQDIVSLGAILARHAQLWRAASAPGELHCHHEARGLARLQERQRNWPVALQLYRRAIELADTREQAEQTTAALARLSRRMGAKDAALELWQSMSSRPGPTRSLAVIECAKLLEHHRRDPAAALSIVQAMLHEIELDEEIRHLTGRGGEGFLPRHAEDLRRRRTRLLRKVDRLHDRKTSRP